MRRCLILFLVFSFFLALPQAVWASTLSLSPSTGTFNQGCTFSLDVMVDTQGTQTDGTDAILIYDSSRFTAQTIKNGIIYPDFPGNNIDASSGKITISGLASVNTPFTGKGNLATINFKVLETAPAGVTQITFDFNPNDKAKTTDSNVVERGTVVDTLNSVTNGSYTVGPAGSCGTQPSVTPLPSFRGAPATPSAQPKEFPTPTLPPAGSEKMTLTIAILGVTLTILGILGLALL